MSKTMTLDEALAKLSDVSERLHSVTENTSGDFRRAMHQQCVEFDEARKVISTHLAEREQAVHKTPYEFAHPEAVKSSANFLLEKFENRPCDSDGINCCIRCATVALSKWALNALTPAPNKEGA